MKLVWLRFAILDILNKWWPPEEPTVAELLEQINVLQDELQKYRQRTYVWIDPTVRARGYEQSAWNSPERNTDIPPALRDAKYVEQIRTQHELPRIPRKLHFTRYDGPPLPDTTMAHIPTWIL